MLELVIPFGIVSAIFVFMFCYSIHLRLKYDLAPFAKPKHKRIVDISIVCIWVIWITLTILIGIYGQV